MMNKSLTVKLLCLPAFIFLIYTPVYSQLVVAAPKSEPDVNEPRAKNNTPGQIWEDIEWMKRVRVSGVSGISSEDDQYFLKYTKPAPGFLHFRNGRILSGNLQIRKLYNKSENDVTRKFIIQVEGKRKVFTPRDIESYYYSFTPAQLNDKVWRVVTKSNLSTGSVYSEYKSQKAKYPAEVFAKGTLTFTDGTTADGLIGFDYAFEAAGGHVYRTVYIAKDANSPAHAYSIKVISEAIKSVGGTTYHFQPLKGGIIELELWVKGLEITKVNKTGPLFEAKINLNDDVEAQGFVALEKTKNPRFAYFLNQEKDKLRYFNKKSEVQIVTIETNNTTYSYSGDYFLSMEAIQKAFDKAAKKKKAKEIHKLVVGTITLSDGSNLEGKVAQQNKRNGGIFYVGSDNKLKIFTRKAIKNFTQDLSGGKMLYHIVKISAYSYTTYKIVSQDEIVTTMPYDGYVVKNGKKHESKVKVVHGVVWYFDENNEITVDNSRRIEEVFINNPDEPEMYLGGNTWVKVYFPLEAISYYKNPYPIYCNEKASKRLADFKAGTRALAAYTAAGVTEMKGRTGELTLKQENENKKKIYDWYTKERDEEDCLVPYREYVIRFNDTGEQLIGYKVNIRSIVRSLILGCEDNNKINKTIRHFDKIKDIHEMVKYVNESRCIKENFVNMESSPIALFRFDPFTLLDAINIVRESSDKERIEEPEQYVDGKPTDGEFTPWYNGWIQTLGGQKVEGIIQLFRNDEATKPSKSTFLNRANIEISGVTIRIREKRKIATLIWEYYIPRDYIRAVGANINVADISGQYETFEDLAAYEPNTESFLEEEVLVFNPNGSIESAGGEVIEGKITMEVSDNLNFGTKALFEDNNGEQTTYTSKDDVSFLRFNDGGGEKVYIPYRDAFVQLLINEGRYRYFINPYPKSSLGFISGLASMMASTQQQIDDPSKDETVEVKIQKREYIFMNMETNEEIIVNSSNYKRMIESYLAVCDDFNNLDKKSKKTYLDDKAPEKTLGILNKCY